jgi:hypothetical protein
MLTQDEQMAWEDSFLCRASKVSNAKDKYQNHDESILCRSEREDPTETVRRDGGNQGLATQFKVLGLLPPEPGSELSKRYYLHSCILELQAKPLIP